MLSRHTAQFLMHHNFLIYILWQIFWGALSTNDQSIDINLEPVCIDYVTVTNIICNWFILSYSLYKVELIRKPFKMQILIHLCQSNFCNDFNIADETQYWSMYLAYIYNSFIFNLFLFFYFFYIYLRGFQV